VFERRGKNLKSDLVLPHFPSNILINDYEWQTHIPAALLAMNELSSYIYGSQILANKIQNEKEVYIFHSG
jgi:hypothetical protein